MTDPNFVRNNLETLFTLAEIVSDIASITTDGFINKPNVLKSPHYNKTSQMLITFVIARYALKGAKALVDRALKNNTGKTRVSYLQDTPDFQWDEINELRSEKSAEVIASLQTRLNKLKSDQFDTETNNADNNKKVMANFVEKIQNLVQQYSDPDTKDLQERLNNLQLKKEGILPVAFCTRMLVFSQNILDSMLYYTNIFNVGDLLFNPDGFNLRDHVPKFSNATAAVFLGFSALVAANVSLRATGKLYEESDYIKSTAFNYCQNIFNNKSMASNSSDALGSVYTYLSSCLK